MTLEKEFVKRVEVHKYQMIASALILYEEDGIYNHYLLKKKYGDNIMSTRGTDRGFYVADELEANAKRGGQKTYDKIYEMCWNRMKKVIKDDKAYNLDNEELQEY